jgi:hypothetical protein
MDGLLLNLFFPFIFIVLLMISILLFWAPRNKKRSAKKLIEMYLGKFQYPFGPVTIYFQNREFQINFMSRGGSRGFYLRLETYIDPFPKTIIGNIHAGSFSNGKFLFLPPHEEVNVDGNLFLVGSSDSLIIEKIKKILNENTIFKNQLAKLFDDHFDHLTIAREIHIVHFLPKIVTVVKFTALNGEVFKNPIELEDPLIAIISFITMITA